MGSCRWSDLCVFSFHAVKIITTGEGGMITTDSATLYEKLCRLRTHGISRDPRHRLQGKRLPWYYEKLELGNHYRMTDIQAALGRSQLKKIRIFQNKREKIAEAYSKSLHHLPLDLPRLTPGARSSWHLFPVCVKKELPFRDQVLAKLHRSGVMGNLHYISVPKLRFYEKMKKTKARCTLARKFEQREVSLPIHPLLTRTQQEVVINCLQKALKKI